MLARWVTLPACVRATCFNRSNGSKEDTSEHRSPELFVSAFTWQEWWVSSTTCPQTQVMCEMPSAPFSALKSTESWNQFCFQLKGAGLHCAFCLCVMLDCLYTIQNQLTTLSHFVAKLYSENITLLREEIGIEGCSQDSQQKEKSQILAKLGNVFSYLHFPNR